MSIISNILKVDTWFCVQIYLCINHFLKNYLFIWLPRVLVSPHGILSFGAWTLVVVYGLSCSTACGILVPWPGTERMSPARQGIFLITGPLVRSPNLFLKFHWPLKSKSLRNHNLVMPILQTKFCLIHEWIPFQWPKAPNHLGLSLSISGWGIGLVAHSTRTL